MNFSTFKHIPPTIIGLKRRFGILIPLIKLDNKWHLLYEVRAFTLVRQPGDICFPGGAIEPFESDCEAAIRETCEELGIKANDIEIIGPMDYLFSNFGDGLFPYVGVINLKNIHALNINKNEVDSVFTVPLDDLMKQTVQHYKLKTNLSINDDFPFDRIQKGKSYNWKMADYDVFFYTHNTHNIWGLTAKITKAFIERLKN